ncbi:MAG: acyloxyacyl hydrolase [Verrucomicrobiota bacterium]
MKTPTLVPGLLFLTLALTLATPLTQALAGETPPPPPVVVEEPFDAFAKGRMELELLAGGFGTFNGHGDAEAPNMTYGMSTLRLGWMLNDPSGSGFFRGNYEILLGAFGGPIIHGPGDYLAGGEVVLRYNFVQPSATVVPFFQLGVGGAHSDAAEEDLVQKMIGADWSFQLQAALGVRWFITERWALTTAVQYQHFSNAGFNERNKGVDAVGGFLGVSYHF